MHEKPAHVSPIQILAREAARGIIHPIFLRNEAIDPHGGLKKFQDMVSSGMGGVIIEMHFSQIDPVWAIDAVTKRHGYRNLPITQPIAADRCLPGLVQASKAMGINLIKVVAPDVKQRADQKGPNDLKAGDGQNTYLHKAVEVVARHGIALVPPKATREPKLVQSERDQAVTSLLLSRLYLRGVTNVAVHFVAFDMDGIQGEEDYKRQRKYNLFRKHRTIHGNTYTLPELIDKAAGPVQEGERERRRARRGLTEMESVVYDELSKIVPASYRS